MPPCVTGIDKLLFPPLNTSFVAHISVPSIAGGSSANIDTLCYLLNKFITLDYTSLNSSQTNAPLQWNLRTTVVIAVVSLTP